ncbi:hypothetical protein SLA2020_385210 [Shorea laevis]
MAPPPSLQISPNLQVLLIHSGNMILLEEALELIISWKGKTHQLWKGEDLFQAWHSPLLTLKSIDQAPFLTLVPALKEDPTVLVDQCSIQKPGSSSGEASVEKEIGPYSTSKIQVPSLGEAPSNLQDEGKNGEDPCYHQILNIAKDGGGFGLQVFDAPIPLPGCNNDAATQGNQGAIV